MVDFEEFSEDKIRFLINLEDRYERWLRAQRETVTGRLQWKGPSGQESLYRMLDGQGNGRSLGPRSPKTEELYAQFQASKEIQEAAENQLIEAFRQYSAFRLPRISGFAGEALRRLDVYGFLGPVQVVGTNALLAYQIEAKVSLLKSMTATEDFDLSWTNESLCQVDDHRWPTTLIQVLKKIDNTYTINTERPFQALNSRGEEIELLMPASLCGTLPPKEGFRPIPMEEQDWLLIGEKISHVIFDIKGKPCRIVAPDPRYFGLQKMWLSEKPSRNKLKVEKDNIQGQTVLNLVNSYMPHYPLDADFEAGLPTQLKPYFESWRQMTQKKPSPSKFGF